MDNIGDESISNYMKNVYENKKNVWSKSETMEYMKNIPLILSHDSQNLFKHEPINKLFKTNAISNLNGVIASHIMSIIHSDEKNLLKSYSHGLISMSRLKYKLFKHVNQNKINLFSKGNSFMMQQILRMTFKNSIFSRFVNHFKNHNKKKRDGIFTTLSFYDFLKRLNIFDNQLFEDMNKIIQKIEISNNKSLNPNTNDSKIKQIIDICVDGLISVHGSLSVFVEKMNRTNLTLLDYKKIIESGFEFDTEEIMGNEKIYDILFSTNTLEDFYFNLYSKTYNEILNNNLETINNQIVHQIQQRFDTFVDPVFLKYKYPNDLVEAYSSPIKKEKLVQQKSESVVNKSESDTSNQENNEPLPTNTSNQGNNEVPPPPDTSNNELLPTNTSNQGNNEAPPANNGKGGPPPPPPPPANRQKIALNNSSEISDTNKQNNEPEPKINQQEGGDLLSRIKNFKKSKNLKSTQSTQKKDKEITLNEKQMIQNIETFINLNNQEILKSDQLIEFLAKHPQEREAIEKNNFVLKSNKLHENTYKEIKKKLHEYMENNKEKVVEFKKLEKEDNEKIKELKIDDYDYKLYNRSGDKIDARCQSLNEIIQNKSDGIFGFKELEKAKQFRDYFMGSCFKDDVTQSQKENELENVSRYNEFFIWKKESPKSQPDKIDVRAAIVKKFKEVSKQKIPGNQLKKCLIEGGKECEKQDYKYDTNYYTGQILEDDDDESDDDESDDDDDDEDW